MLNVRVLFLLLGQLHLFVSFDGQFAFCVCRLLGNSGKFFHFFISAPNDEADDGCAQKEGEPKNGFCLVWVEHLFLFCVLCFRLSRPRREGISPPLGVTSRPHSFNYSTFSRYSQFHYISIQWCFLLSSFPTRNRWGISFLRKTLKKKYLCAIWSVCVFSVLRYKDTIWSRGGFGFLYFSVVFCRIK